MLQNPLKQQLVTNKRFSWRFLRTSATCKKIFLEISADICYMQCRLPKISSRPKIFLEISVAICYMQQVCRQIRTFVYNCHALLINTCICMQSACLGATHSQRAQHARFVLILYEALKNVTEILTEYKADKEPKNESSFVPISV